jgi:hypothetical protein
LEDLAALRSIRKTGVAPAQQFAFGLDFDGVPATIASWYNFKIWIEAFGHRVETPGINTVGRQELERLIMWVRSIGMAKQYVPPFSLDGALFKLNAEIIDSDRFWVTLKVNDYDQVPRNFVEVCGITVLLAADRVSLGRFADELEETVKPNRETTSQEHICRN